MGRDKIVEGIELSDSFLVSYPRSGNTWLRYLLANLLYPEYEWNIENLNKAVPDLHQCDGLEKKEKMGTRVIKSHHAFQGNYPRVIYLYRDLRDISLSYYDMQTKLRGYEDSFHEFSLKFLKQGFGFGRWQDHVNSWLFAEHKIPLLKLKYEELVAGPKAIIDQLGFFLGLDWKPEEITEALSKSTFARQQKDFYSLKFTSHWSKGFRGGVKGAPGKWKEVFDENTNDLYWDFAGEILVKLGYKREM